MYEIILAGAATVVAILVQVFYFRKLTNREPTSKDSFVTARLDELDQIDSYQEKYEKFLDEARSDMVDSEIKEYLSRNGYGTMKT